MGRSWFLLSYRCDRSGYYRAGRGVQCWESVKPAPASGGGHHRGRSSTCEKGTAVPPAHPHPRNTRFPTFCGHRAAGSPGGRREPAGHVPVAGASRRVGHGVVKTGF